MSDYDAAKIDELRRGLEEAAATFGILASIYRAKEPLMAEQMLAFRNKATAALDRAGYPYQEDPPKEKP